MRNIPAQRVAFWIVQAACWSGATGCTHNYYYGGLPACAPGGQAVTTQVGPVCEVPSGQEAIISSGATTPGMVIRTNPTDPGPATVSPPRKVVISQPAYGPALARNPGHFGRWRRPDPEGLATIRTEGGLSDDTIQR